LRAAARQRASHARLQRRKRRLVPLIEKDRDGDLETAAPSAIPGATVKSRSLARRHSRGKTPFFSNAVLPAPASPHSTVRGDRRNSLRKARRLGFA